MIENVQSALYFVDCLLLYKKIYYFIKWLEFYILFVKRKVKSRFNHKSKYFQETFLFRMGDLNWFNPENFKRRCDGPSEK